MLAWLKRLFSREVLVRIELASEDFRPRYMTSGAACCDLRARIITASGQPDHISIFPGQTACIDCGIKIDLPPGYEAQIRPRSGLASKGLFALFGTIDSDYKQDVKVIVANVGRHIVRVSHLDRIAQMAVAPVCRIDWSPVSALEDRTGRGGFGSTGT